MSRQTPASSSYQPSKIVGGGSPVLKSVQPSSVVEEPLRLKRKHQPIDDEDIENAMPPIKQAKQYPQNYSVESEIDLTVSSEYSGDEHCSSVSLPENLDDIPSSCSEASSEECSPLKIPETPQDASNSINNNCSDIENDEDFESNKNKCPLPALPWADPNFVWKRLCDRDTKNSKQRSPNMLLNHPSLKPRMRAILLDWLNEVSEVFKMRRETFHLCIYYIDRYLTNTKNVNKNCLQLIGITCLFIASKFEEIYPPKVQDFAYVTDGACTPENILDQELCILRVLNWNLSPISCYGWLSMYLQLSNEKFANKLPVHTENDKDGLKNYAFLFSEYSSLDFVICIQLIDLALLHVEVNAFKYSQLTAAAIAHCFNKDMAMKASGYKWSEISPCYLWLQPFVQALEDFENFESNRNAQSHDSTHRNNSVSRKYPNVNPEQSHRVQVHNISMEMFDKVEKYKILIESSLNEDLPSDPEDVPVFTSDDYQELTPDKDGQEDNPVLTPGGSQQNFIPQDLKEEISLLTPPDSSHKKHMKIKTLIASQGGSGAGPSKKKSKSITSYMISK